jgi:TonB family protein
VSGGRLLLGVVLLLLAASASALAQAKPEPCYCPAPPRYGPGVGRGHVYGVPNNGEPARCTGLRVAYKMKEVDGKAKLTDRAQPSYTEAARENRVEGVVRLRVVLCPSGSVSNVRVVKGLPDGLTEQAIVAARKIKFEPAEKDGEQVAQFVVLEYNFRL